MPLLGRPWPGRPLPLPVPLPLRLPLPLPQTMPARPLPLPLPMPQPRPLAVPLTSLTLPLPIARPLPLPLPPAPACLLPAPAPTTPPSAGARGKHIAPPTEHSLRARVRAGSLNFCFPARGRRLCGDSHPSPLLSQQPFRLRRRPTTALCGLWEQWGDRVCDAHHGGVYWRISDQLATLKLKPESCWGGDVRRCPCCPCSSIKKLLTCKKKKKFRKKNFKKKISKRKKFRKKNS